MGKANDVVYILKNDCDGYELLYSLRSLENIEHGKVWFVGGQPEGLYPDGRMAFQQEGNTKWERVRNSLVKVCHNKDISDEFWLFNDDFFVLKPIDETPMFNGLLRDHILHVEHRHGDHMTGYTKRLRECEQVLEDSGLPTFNYAIHVPMLINKLKMRKCLSLYPETPMFRSIYGNYAEIGGNDHKDVKIIGTNTEIPKDADLVSTSDESFLYGVVGQQIRDRFGIRCRYEDEDDTVQVYRREER